MSNQSLSHKVCPVILRSQGDGLEVLAFEHPAAGPQLVKGSIEAGESVSDAALRELREESGITDAQVVVELSEYEVPEEGQRWSLVLCDAPNLSDGWEHFCEDDGGHSFRFFWQDLLVFPDDSWHPLFRVALDQIRRAIIDATDDA